MTDQREHEAQSGEAAPEGLNTEERAALTATNQDRRRNPVREVVETIVIAFLIALLIRHFVVEVFIVDGKSMEPTLYTSERLLVNKFIYRLRNPHPGEIIVFRYPRNPDRDFIKRVVAVEGDTVEIIEGTVYVNGVALDEPYVTYHDNGTFPAKQVPPKSVWVLGDNRNNSEDSRYFEEVPLRFIKGRAFFRFWPPARFQSFPAAATVDAGG